MPAQTLKQDAWDQMERRLPEAYLALALVLTVLLCWMTPPFFAPDESDHAAREISLTHGHLIEREGPDGASDDIDSDVVHVTDAMDDIRMNWEKHAGFFLDRSYGPVTDEQQLAQAGKRWSGRTIFEPFENTAVYPPLLYLPAMAGWKTGEAAGWTVFASLRLARLLCALCAVALGWLALRFCVGMRWVLLAGLLLPSVLYLNATCCQDALIPGLAALAVAMLSRPLAGRRGFTRAELTVAATALGLIAMARPPYAAMALMLFVPVAELRGGWRQWRAPAAALAAVAVLTGLWWHRVSSLVTATNDLGEPDVQRIFLRQHPFAAVLALLRGTTYAGYDFLHRGVYVIGLNDLLPHQGAAAVLTLCLLAIVLWAPGPVAESWCGRALLAVSVAAPLLGVSLAEYLIWTPPGGATVFGVMPRYWFAAMPPGLLLLESCLPWRALNRKMAGVACVAMALVACTLPWMVAHAFYREGVWHVLRLSLR
jgi:uncharacterized membrane protein